MGGGQGLGGLLVVAQRILTQDRPSVAAERRRDVGRWVLGRTFASVKLKSHHRVIAGARSGRRAHGASLGCCAAGDHLADELSGSVSCRDAEVRYVDLCVEHLSQGVGFGFGIFE